MHEDDKSYFWEVVSATLASIGRFKGVKLLCEKFATLLNNKIKSRNLSI